MSEAGGGGERPPVVVNLGCGGRKKPGQIGIDRYRDSHADIIAELAEGIPLADGSADEVVAEHVLEHVPDLVRLMEEIHRVLVPGGVLRLEVPYFAHPDAFRDPTHVRFFTWGSLDYFVVGMKPAVYSGVSYEYDGKELGFGGGLRSAAGRLIARLSIRRYEKYWARSFPARVLRASLIRI
jgi:SAM-dependent methyltransferase